MLTCLTSSINVFAETNHSHADNGVEPRAQLTCPSGGKHNMAPIGVGYVYGGPMSKPGPKLIAGQTSQCRYCQLVVITEYNPFHYYYTAPGKFAFWNPGYNVSGLVEMFSASVDSFYGQASSDPFWQGFEFKTYG